MGKNGVFSRTCPGAGSPGAGIPRLLIIVIGKNVSLCNVFLLNTYYSGCCVCGGSFGVGDFKRALTRLG